MTVMCLTSSNLNLELRLRSVVQIRGFVDGTGFSIVMVDHLGVRWFWLVRA